MGIDDKTSAYARAGVDYSSMDPFKRLAQQAARSTEQYALMADFTVVPWSRGESAFLIDLGDRFLGFVEEGLGTKNIVADALAHSLGNTVHRSVAQDAFAMIVNDLITVGAFPAVSAMHLAVGDSAWFDNTERAQALVQGWANACIEAECIWGGGETPTLKDIVAPQSYVLSGSAFGFTLGRTLFAAEHVQPGDQIIFFESSGIHANGLTLARKIADQESRRVSSYTRRALTALGGRGFIYSSGYDALLADGRTFGEALTVPTHLYVSAVRDCVRAGVTIHYGVNITGHGWRKLMRAPQPLTYVIDVMPTENALFHYMQEVGGLSEHEAYGTLNMGAGFALFVPESDVARVLKLSNEREWPFRAFHAGTVEEGEKQLVILPKHLFYKAEDLAIR